MWHVTLQLKRHSDKINGISMSHDENYIATASSDKRVGIYNCKTQRQIFLNGHTDSITSVEFSPKNNVLVSVSHDNSFIAWNAETGEKIHQVSVWQKPVRCLCWSPDGQKLVVGSHDKTSIMWSATDFSRMQILPALEGWVRSVQWKDDLIAIGGNDKTVPIYDVRVGSTVQVLATESSSDITALSFHHSGSLLAGSGFDRSYRLWDLRSSNVVRVQQAHDDIVTDIKFHPDNDDLLTVGVDGIARIWNSRTDSLITSFRQHDGPVNACCWYPKSSGFVTVGDDMKICGFTDATPTNHSDIDGGDVLKAFDRMQGVLEDLTNTMKKLDDRLISMEERVRWLKDNNKPISRAHEKIKEWM